MGAFLSLLIGAKILLFLINREWFTGLVKIVLTLYMLQIILQIIRWLPYS